MTNGWPITKYQFEQIKNFSRTASVIIVAILLAVNVIVFLVRDRIKINPASYDLKDGFPVFTSGQTYVNLIRNYPYNPGTELKIHTMKKGETFWDIARNNQITIDTIIAANPFLKSLNASDGLEIIVPQEDGVLLPFDNVTDVFRMSGRLDHYEEISGSYLPHIFRLFIIDDIKLAFFKSARPVIVNKWMEKIYSIKTIFQSPIIGYYTSYFGDRYVTRLEGMEFHNGIDIMAKIGTPIRPVREGIVSGTGWQDGYGLTVTIQHPDGYISMYGHLASIKVKKGDMVYKKDTIATVGITGRTTGPHLHFVMWRHGKLINPILFIW
jgi:murein DD-endopeptidase MepM/ murein hydrolase activator NlpD